MCGVGASPGGRGPGHLRSALAPAALLLQALFHHLPPSHAPFQPNPPCLPHRLLNLELLLKFGPDSWRMHNEGLAAFVARLQVGRGLCLCRWLWGSAGLAA